MFFTYRKQHVDGTDVPKISDAGPSCRARRPILPFVSLFLGQCV